MAKKQDNTILFTQAFQDIDKLKRNLMEAEQEYDKGILIASHYLRKALEEKLQFNAPNAFEEKENGDVVIMNTIFLRTGYDDKDRHVIRVQALESFMGMCIILETDDLEEIVHFLRVKFKDFLTN